MGGVGVSTHVVETTALSNSKFGYNIKLSLRGFLSRDPNARRSPFRRPRDRCAKGPGVPPFSQPSEGSARAPVLFLRRIEPSWHQQPGVLLREAGRSSNFSSAPSNRRQGQEDPRRSPSQPFPPLRALRRPCHADGQGKDEAGTHVKVRKKRGDAFDLPAMRTSTPTPRRVGGRLLRPGLLANLRYCASPRSAPRASGLA